MNSGQNSWPTYAWSMGIDEDDCDDDSKCNTNGICNADGKCQCTVIWAGPNCTTHNRVYFHSFSLVFYGLMTVSFIQLFFCIRAEYIRQKKKSLFKACRITVQKFLYVSTAVACLSRGLLFSFSDSSFLPEHLYKPTLCIYYALITSSLALIVCYWCEIFFTEDAAHGAAKRPRFLTKSRLAFTIFNSLLLGLLLIHFAASHFHEPKEHDQNMIFPAVFATVLLIVHIMFLVIGVEIYCKIRGAFVSDHSDVSNVDKVQAIHSRLGLFFQWGLTLFLIIFIICEVAGVPKIVANVTFRSIYEITFRLLELGSILWFPCILWNSTSPEKLWALNPKKLLLPDPCQAGISEMETGERDRSSIKTESKNDCWICYDSTHDHDLISPCMCKGDVAFVHHECLRRWLQTEETKHCSVCNYKYQISQDIMDFDSTLKNIHWALVVPSVVLILFIPYGTYLICRQAEKHVALDKHSTLIKSSAVIICLLIEYAVLRLIGMSGLRLYRTAANAAVKIKSYPLPENSNREQEQILIKPTHTNGTRV